MKKYITASIFAALGLACLYIGAGEMAGVLLFGALVNLPVKPKDTHEL